MAKSIPQKELEFIFNSIKSDSNEIHWSFFVSEAKQHIINSLTLFRKEDQCRSHWMRYFSNEVAKLGYKPNIGLDNWFIIQKHVGEHCKSSSATSSSSMPPPPTSPMIPPMSPISTHQTQAADSNSTSRSASSLGILLSDSKRQAADSNSTSRSASSLGTLLSDSKRQAALYHYDNMQNDKKWKLQSGRYVKDIMADVVRVQNYEQYSFQYFVLDLTDDNWLDIFSPEEFQKIKRLSPSTIQYPQLPDDMSNFMIEIPDTESLVDIFNHLESKPLDYNTQKHLLWVKRSIQDAIYLIDNNYLPINDQSEEDICTQVWKFVGNAFATGKLTARKQKPSSASKEAIHKKRKIALFNATNKQQHSLIPDMTTSHGSQEYAIIEVAKTDNNIKQLVEGNKKCPELMSHMFDQILASYPTEQRKIEIHGCLLSKLTCTPLMLTNPFGYVKIITQDNQIKHPEVKDTFKPDMTALLQHFWGFKLAIEATVKTMTQSRYNNSPFKQK